MEVFIGLWQCQELEFEIVSYQSGLSATLLINPDSDWNMKRLGTNVDPGLWRLHTLWWTNIAIENGHL